MSENSKFGRMVNGKGKRLERGKGNLEELYKFFRMTWAGHVVHMREGRGVYRVLVGKPEGKRPLGRPRRRWENNIGMDLQDVGCGCVDWIGLAQDRDR
jgi:hypothetical protein